jgi:hypothetical protein
MSESLLGSLDAEIERVRALNIDQLRTLWRATFGLAPPPVLTKDLIARGIAYHIQEQAFGGLDRATVKLLAGLLKGPPVEGRRRLKAGTVLVREYQGERHTVTVAPGGFVWREVTYGSLSSIARAITGTSWNGPRFFGLEAQAAVKRSQKPPRSAPEERTNRSRRPQQSAGEQGDRTA